MASNGEASAGSVVAADAFRSQLGRLARDGAVKDLPLLAIELYAEEIISGDDCDKAADSSDKTTTDVINLLRAVEKHLRERPTDFETVVSVLAMSAALSSASDCASELRKAYDKKDATSRKLQMVNSPTEESENDFMCGTCLDSITQGTSAQRSGEDESIVPAGQGAWAYSEKIWMKPDHQLKVYFRNEDEIVQKNWTYKKRLMNTDQIIAWANVWSSDRRLSGGHKIPRFERTDDEEKSDIRVQFQSKGRCHTIVGSQADEGKYKGMPTMWLNLNSGNDSYIYHLVLHEFGHALGLEHEHQHPLFLRHYAKFIDVGRLKNDPELLLTDEQFEVDWGDHQSGMDTCESPYDPKSIMHYWYKKKWLKTEYQRQNFDKSKLSDDERQILDGILLRGNLATELSDTDIQFVEEAYKGTTGAPPQAHSAKKQRFAADSGGPDDDDDDEDGKKSTREGPEEVQRTGEKFALPRTVKEELSGVSDWFELGEYLGMECTTLTDIQRDNRNGTTAQRNQMIENWMKIDQKASWKNLCTALEKIRQNVLADNIRRKYPSRVGV